MNRSVCSTTIFRVLIGFKRCCIGVNFILMFPKLFHYSMLCFMPNSVHSYHLSFNLNQRDVFNHTTCGHAVPIHQKHDTQTVLLLLDFLKFQSFIFGCLLGKHAVDHELHPLTQLFSPTTIPLFSLNQTDSPLSQRIDRFIGQTACFPSVRPHSRHTWSSTE